ncbi:MAG: MBL fold metallo-hydrolase [Deltaproteobacteria bacterium]|nr:MBL fold metallo-hydrolase [Deltaproteobacteria bacterium]
MISVTTIGNATMVVRDNSVVLVTDPWMGEEDHAYFGSWNLSHVIPADIKHDIFSTKYVWFSHGHPDHLNAYSLPRFKGKTILLPDHVGSRMQQDLTTMGYDVFVLPDRQWITLSDHVRVFCITTIIQDAVLLVEAYGRLFVNCNDAGSRGCTRLIRRIAAQYPHSYLLSIMGYGDADMINFYGEDGKFVPTLSADEFLLGDQLSLMAKSLRINHVIPFSSFHQYQREDSLWASQYVTPLSAYREGFHPDLAFIPPFVTIDCRSGEVTEVNPALNVVDVHPPEFYGDSWSEELSTEDTTKLDTYFTRKDGIRHFLSFLNFHVGGKDHYIPLGGTQHKGITFAVPRQSLMTAIEYEAFDDLLIGNFMKTTLHNMDSLYEGEFNFYVTKYGDNGRAQSAVELDHYFQAYRHRIGREYMYEAATNTLMQFAKRCFARTRGSTFYTTAKRAYYTIVK